MSDLLRGLELKTGRRLFDWQRDTLVAALGMTGPAQRLCLYYKTGSGKSLTALGTVALWGHSEVVVVTPPATFGQWLDLGDQLGVKVLPMSHAKFRMKDTKLSRGMPVIADEMHLFGGHGGVGWKKLDKLAMHLRAPLVLASATPNYNDAERVYCIQHVLDPNTCRGGYIEFLYKHCETRNNPFGMEPLVDGFLHHKDAAAYLAALPGVHYLPDDLVYSIVDVPVLAAKQPELDRYGLNLRTDRIVASLMEERHARVNLALIRDDGLLADDPYQVVMDLVAKATTPVLVFAAHATVADALERRLFKQRVLTHRVVSGGSTTKQKNAGIKAFIDGQVSVLIGTATLATGTDGLDRVCDTLVILDDTDDDSLRRQLIGRIMPRGTSSNAAAKQVYRLVLL